MRRFVHDFLKWAGPSIVLFCGGCIGLVAALAQSYPGVKDWGKAQFDGWWPILSAPWFLLSAAIAIAAYVAALVWTGQEARTIPANAPNAKAEKPQRSRLAARKADARQPNMTIQGLAAHLSQALPCPNEVPDESATHWLEQQIMDKIAMHDLAVWGRHGHSALERLQWLSAGYFTLYWDHGTLYQHRRGESPTLWGTGYSDLHFNADDVRRIWPYA